jgi:hypothetical protein
MKKLGDAFLTSLKEPSTITRGPAARLHAYPRSAHHQPRRQTQLSGPALCTSPDCRSRTPEGLGAAPSTVPLPAATRHTKDDPTSSSPITHRADTTAGAASHSTQSRSTNASTSRNQRRTQPKHSPHICNARPAGHVTPTATTNPTPHASASPCPSRAELPPLKPPRPSVPSRALEGQQWSSAWALGLQVPQRAKTAIPIGCSALGRRACGGAETGSRLADAAERRAIQGTKWAETNWIGAGWPAASEHAP